MIGTGHREAESLVKSFGRVTGFDEQTDRLRSGVRLIGQCAQEAGTDALAAPFRQQGNVDQVEDGGATTDIQTPDGLVPVANHREVGIVVMRLVITVLGVELLSEEGRFGRFIPGHRRHFVGARACIKLPQECCIGIHHGAKFQLKGWHETVRPC
ncbi:hypothetical protein FQZ97_768750 [compost metagenome]